MIKNKEISSAELTKSVFDRIKAVEGKVDAYLTLDEENAMKKAAEIDEKLAKGEELSPLAGIPLVHQKCLAIMFRLSMQL